MQRLTYTTCSTNTQLRTQGFSLVELLIAVAIIAILAAIALPAYQNHIAKSKITAAYAELAAHQTPYMLVVNAKAEAFPEWTTSQNQESSATLAGFNGTSSGNCSRIEVSRYGMSCYIRNAGRLETTSGRAVIRIRYTAPTTANAGGLHCVTSFVKTQYIPKGCKNE